MATYHVTVVPRPGEEPHPATCPLMPCDVMADSEADALDQAGSCIAETMQCVWEAYLAHGDTEILDREMDEIEQWQPIVRHVDRPAVALEPRAEIIAMPHGGQLYDYGETTGTESFDVLIDGSTCGRLERRAATAAALKIAAGNVAPIGNAVGERVWLIAAARGPLMPFAGRRWPDRSPAGRGQMMRWLDTILADIRAALEAR
jgi:hypothetical protein